MGQFYTKISKFVFFNNLKIILKILKIKKLDNGKLMHGFPMDGWMDEWEWANTGLRIAYSNQIRI